MHDRANTLYNCSMERKLATIQQVSAIKSIPNADSIECVRVMGWDVVVKKGEFNPGDLGIFCEIDSVLPDDAEWAQFMKPKGFRIKTAKLRGCLSQGLFFPLSIVQKDHQKVFNVGDDVTDQLRIKKYEPLSVGPEVAGSFPNDVKKTDEIRLQSILPIIEELKDKPFYVTVKMDGASGTFIRREDGLQVCSRNNRLKENGGPHWSVARKYDLANKLPVDFAVQGEVCGPSIQKNRLKLKEIDLFVFNVFDVKNGKYLSWDDAAFFCHKHGLKTVPFEFEVSGEELKNFPFTLENFLELAKGEYPGTGNRREGIVIRPLVECQSATLCGDRLSFKVINNDWLLRDEE